MEAQTLDIHMTFSGNTGQGHQHTPGLQQDLRTGNVVVWDPHFNMAPQTLAVPGIKTGYLPLAPQPLIHVANTMATSLTVWQNNNNKKKSLTAACIC